MAKTTVVLRSRIVMVFAIMFSSIALIKLIYIQTVQGPNLRRISAQLHFEQRKLKPIRGNITDCNGNLLATTLPFYRLALDPSVMDDVEFYTKAKLLSQELSSFFKNKSAYYYQQLISKARIAGKRYVVLNRSQINHNDKYVVQSWPIFNERIQNNGGIFEKSELRFKPFKSLANRTIGYVNANNKGVGIEYTYNRELEGKYGSALYQKTTGGVWKIVDNGEVQRAQDGYEVETTLDINLQDTVHSSLLRVLNDSEADNGCAIVMEVHTGAIRAIVNLTRTKDGRYEEHYNYAVGDAKEPGSIFKLASMIALFEHTDLSLEDKVDTGKGPMQFYDRKMTEAQNKEFGELTVQEIFEKSSNIGTSMLIEEHFGKNPQKFIDALEKLSLHKPTGIQILGESAPYIPSIKDKIWSGVSLPWISIGYGVQFSPLQMLVLYNAVANNGTMVQPMLVKSIKDANIIVQDFPTKVIVRKICSDRTLVKLRKMLEGVVERGTAKKFRHGFYKIAGKSGTANVVVNGKYTRDTYVSFVGYFPADKPTYSCIVVMNCPRTAVWHFGASLASVVKEIADNLASKDLEIADKVVVKTEAADLNSVRIGNRNDLISICKKYNIKCDSKISKGFEYVRGVRDNNKKSIKWEQQSFISGLFPNVCGMTLRDSLYILENLKVHVVIEGKKSGRVQTQSISPGNKVLNGSVVYLYMR